METQHENNEQLIRLTQIKNMLDKENSLLTEVQRNELKSLVDEQIARVDKDTILNNTDFYKKLLSALNYSSVFAAVGASSGLILSTIVGTAILPGAGTILGAVLGFGFKALMGSTNDSKEEKKP